MENKFDKIVPIIHQFNSFTAVLKYMNLSLSGKRTNSLQKYLSENEIDISHFKNSGDKLQLISDEDFIKAFSKFGTAKGICKHFELNYAWYNHKIHQRMRQLNISFDEEITKKNRNFWLSSEDAILKKYFEQNDYDFIQNMLPNRSLKAIKVRAWVLKLKPRNEGFSNSDLHNLLNDNLESYYWIGFILADGHVSTENPRITIKISDYDADYLQKFCEYIKYNKSLVRHDNMVSVAIAHKTVVTQLIQKFDIHNQKTYNPPKPEMFNNLTNDQFLALFIGFIDGDGCMSYRKHLGGCIITITCHSAWLHVFELFVDRLISIFDVSTPNPTMSKHGYIRMDINKAYLVTELKNFTITHNLPVMKRKWEKIDVDIMKLKTKRFRNHSRPVISRSQK